MKLPCLFTCFAWKLETLIARTILAKKVDSREKKSPSGKRDLGMAVKWMEGYLKQEICSRVSGLNQVLPRNINTRPNTKYGVSRYFYLQTTDLIVDWGNRK